MDKEKISFLGFKYSSNFSVDIIQQNINKIYNKYVCILNVTLLIINIILIINLFNKYKDYSLGNNKFISEIGNNSLYYLFKYPQISIIISVSEIINLYKNNSLTDCIIMLRNQKLKDIEFLFFLHNDVFNYYKLIKNYSKFDSRIKIISQKSNNNDNPLHLITQAKGKFILIMNKFEIFDCDEIEKYYNLTKGNINNIIKFNSSNGNDIYLIKTKILRDIMDKEISFKDFSNIISYVLSLPKPHLNFVSIALSPDNLYTAYTYVVMLSILNSKNYLTYISFYIIIAENFEQKNIDFLNSLYDQYDLFNITYIKMDNRYDLAYISRYLTKQTYHRFSVAELITCLNRIIYLDTDIIVYNDLNDFYNLNFNGKIILGQPTFFNKSTKTGVYKINNGVLLLNLKKMRDIHIEEKILYLLKNGFQNDYHDQFLLNQFFYEIIGIFPPKYHIRPWKNFNELKSFNKQSGKVYDNDYLYFSSKYPTILHYAYNTKPIFSNSSNSEDWWYFARKSKYFSKKTENISNIFNFTYNGKYCVI